MIVVWELEWLGREIWTFGAITLNIQIPSLKNIYTFGKLFEVSEKLLKPDSGGAYI